MPLNKTSGNMYPWITHTHSHLAGECPYKCQYCYVQRSKFMGFKGYKSKHSGPIHLQIKELLVNYGRKKIILIEHQIDMFHPEVSDLMIENILRHCRQYPQNLYVFQTKNPQRLHDLLCLRHGLFPPEALYGCTIETNRSTEHLSSAPSTIERRRVMATLPTLRKFITIEPILDFDVEMLGFSIAYIKPLFVNIGADSKGTGLEEPTGKKVRELIEYFKRHNISVRIKPNLKRILPC